MTQNGKLDPANEVELPELAVADLDAAVLQLVRQGDRLAAVIARQTRTQFWLIIVGLLLISALAVTALDTRRAVSDLGLKLCPIVRVSVPLPGEAPPTTERGRVVAEKAAQLARDLRC